MVYKSSAFSRGALIAATILAFSSIPTIALAASSTNITTGAITDLTPDNATQGSTNVAIFSFEVTTGAAASEKFKSMVAHYTGTDKADIAKVYLYKESGTIAGSSFDSSTDTLLDSSGASNDTTLDPNPDISLATSTAYKFYIVVDIDSAATVGNSVDFKIAADKIKFNSGTWPSAADVTAKGWDPAGSTAITSSITTDAVAQVGPASVLQGATKVSIVSLTLSNTDATEKFKSMKVRWTGTAASPNTDIGNVYLYQESGTISGSSFDSSTDTLKDTTAAGAGTEINLNPADFFFNPQAKFYIVVDVKAGATLGNHIDFKVEANKIILTSNTWPPTSEVTAETWNPAGDTVISLPTATLTVTKIVTNDNGGTKIVSNFPLFIDGMSVTSGVASTTSTGAHTVSETSQAGYTGTIGGDCAANGTITLAGGGTATCTITNDDIAPSLTLVKSVTNNSGGTAPASAWTLTATGALGSPTNLSGTTSVASGVGFKADTYTLAESGGPSGYTASTYSCVKNGGAPVISNTITLALGDTATCTITNDDQPGTLIVNKVLLNNNGGTAATTTFAYKIDGGASVAFEADASNSNTVNAGSHSVVEDATAGYTATYANSLNGTANCNSLTVPNGGTVTCTITNDDIAPTLTLVKTVDNGTDPSATLPVPSDWTLTATGPTSISGASGSGGVTSASVDAGSYTLSESVGPSHYAQSGGWHCEGNSTELAGSELTLKPGENVSCTVHNAYVPPGTITIVKNTVGDNGTFSFSGDLGEFDLTTTDGSANQSFSGLDPNTYSVTEGDQPAGWEAGTFSCDNGDTNPSAIHLTSGGSVICTFTDTKDARIIVQKITDPTGEEQSFDFTTDYGDEEFTLSDGGQNDSGYTLTPNDTYNISESIPDGWAQGSATCDNGNSPSEVTPAPGQTVTCTFTNDKRPTLTIIKHTDEASGDGTFHFTVTQGDSTVTTQDITTDGGVGPTELVQLNLSAGSYDVNEVNLPEGWYFGSVSCVYDDHSIGSTIVGSETIAGGEHITVDNGDSVTCTFTNTTHPVPPAPTISPDSIVFHGSVDVSLASEGAASIRYTTTESTESGVAPTCEDGTLYSGPFTLSNPTTVEAVACNESGDASSVSTAVFTSAGGGGGGGGEVLGASTGPESTTTPSEGTTTPQGAGGGDNGQVLGAQIFQFLKNLYYGLYDPDVAQLQQYLVGKGYSIPHAVTEYFGPETLAAAKLYQAAHGLTPTGFVGPLTRIFLNAGL